MIEVWRYKYSPSQGTLGLKLGDISVVHPKVTKRQKLSGSPTLRIEVWRLISVEIGFGEAEMS